MLEGLEAVEMKMSELISENETFRLDSEYFKKEYLLLNELLSIKNFKTLSELGVHIRHPKEIKRIYVEKTNNNYGFLQAQNLKAMYVDIDVNTFISRQDAQILRKNIIKQGDILIVRTGANAGTTALFFEQTNPKKLFASSHVFIVDSAFTNPFLLAIFLNTTYGVKLIQRARYGSAQPQISVEYLYNKVKIPFFPIDFQSYIQKLVISSHAKLEKAKSLYTQAERLLLEELDLVGFKPSKENIAVKKLSESLGSTGRLDAEYYQPKYEEVIWRITKANYQLLGDIVHISKSIEPGSDKYQSSGISFIRVSDITKYGISKSNIKLSPELFDQRRLSTLQPKKDTILFSKDGTVGIAYNIKNETNIITSSALLHLTLKSNDCLPEYLTLVLNSIVVQMQGERDIGGSIIKHWLPSEIQNLLIPIIDLDIQKQISELIQRSFELRSGSSELLEVAKQAVEMAIEQDEEVAIKWLETKAPEITLDGQT